ncbi:MAG: hypothetical protein RLZZ383_1036 [Pseudomonadota bacterium]|jgi:hypothetical protein
MTRLAAVLSLVLFACSVPETGDPCTTEARASVQVLVTPDQETAPDLTLTYTVDGGPEAPCTWVARGEAVCGFEETGTFVVTATASDYGTATFTADVLPGTCHVETVLAEITIGLE